MSAYDHVKKGSLKFKGGDSSSSIKKKKKKSKSKSEKEKLERALRDKSPEQEEYEAFQKTEAERKFEETKRQRQMERVAKQATQSHKDRVAEFNQKLENLSEHHDIPKVGPG